jgi:hypothetical protein
MSGEEAELQRRAALDGQALVLGAVACFALLLYVVYGCGDPAFKNFAQGCDGIATYSERDGVTTMECDRGTTDGVQRPRTTRRRDSGQRVRPNP